MATVNYTISTSVGQTWSGTFEGVTLGNPVNDPGNLPTTITADSGAISFSPNNFQLYPADTNANYVTWRDQPAAGQYPTNGYSLDIWSDALYSNIDGSNTWADLIATGTYNLSPSKNTLIYNYDTPYAPHWGSGGTITFS
jgi:hypothetical protein